MNSHSYQTMTFGVMSKSGKGNPYDNVWLESFMKTLKYEEIYMGHYETYLDVIEKLSYFIEEVYNKKRLHSSIGHLPPEEFENKLILNVSLLALAICIFDSFKI